MNTHDILQFEDGKSLLITSNRAVCTPEGSAMSYERYSAEERTDSTMTSREAIHNFISRNFRNRRTLRFGVFRQI